MIAKDREKKMMMMRIFFLSPPSHHDKDDKNMGTKNSFSHEEFFHSPMRLSGPPKTNHTANSCIIYIYNMYTLATYISTTSLLDT